MKFTSLFPLMTQTLCLQFGSLVASHPSGQGGKQPDLPRSSQAKPINYRNGQISIHNEPSDRCSRDGTVAACASIFCYDKEPKCAEGAWPQYFEEEDCWTCCWCEKDEDEDDPSMTKGLSKLIHDDSHDGNDISEKGHEICRPVSWPSKPSCPSWAWAKNLAKEDEEPCWTCCQEL